MTYTLEKTLWTDQDFDDMGWHDSRIHSIATIPEKFEVMFDIDVGACACELEIDSLEKGEPFFAPDGKTQMYEFKLLCHQGEIFLKAKGFKMFVKKAPVFTNAQILELGERGGINFDREMK